MSSVVSLLPDEHAEKVQDLRITIRDELGISSPLECPYPHFTYQLAEKYDVHQLESVLEQISEQQERFAIRTNGLAIFTDTKPVIYIPVIRNSQLSRFQSNIWGDISEAASNVADYYHPNRWVPHITVGLVNRDEVSDVVGLLSENDFLWEIPVDNIAHLRGSTGEIGREFSIT